MTQKDFQRQTSFFDSDTPLVSNRVRVILSSPEDTERLLQAIWESQESGDWKEITFSISEEVQEIIKKSE